MTMKLPYEYETPKYHDSGFMCHTVCFFWRPKMDDLNYDLLDKMIRNDHMFDKNPGISLGIRD